MATYCGIPGCENQDANKSIREYKNKLMQIKKERKLGKHYGSNKAVGKLMRKK